MAQHELKFGLIIVITTMFCTLSLAQSMQPTAPTSPSLPSCPPAQISLSPCIGYIFGASSSSMFSCCTQLKAFFASQGPCLCAAIKLAPSQVGLAIGQAQSMLPNICNFPSNPCDDVSGQTIVPATPIPMLAPTAAPVTPMASPTTTPTNPDEPEVPPDSDEPEVPSVPAEDASPAVTTPDQTTPTGVGSNTASGIGSKIPALLNSAGTGSSRDMAATGVLISLLVAYVSTHALVLM